MKNSRSFPTTRVPMTSYRRAEPSSADTLRLDRNEGDYPPSLLLRRLATLEPDALRDYPDAFGLENAIADRFGVEAERVVVTAGADDALDRVCRAYLEPGRELLVPIPTFEMIHRFAAAAGGDVRTVPWRESAPTEELIRSIGADTALIAIVSPNNPTGSVVSSSDLRRIAESADSAYVLLDHAYVEYADEDLTSTAVELDNVIVVRTFSKAWGLAGCRVGYAIAPPAIAGVIRNAGNPYPVSSLSVAVVKERLRIGEAAMTAHVSQIRSERERLKELLDSLGVSSPRSQGNFLFAELGDRAKYVYDALANGGVLVRYFPTKEETRFGLRISLPGNQSAFERLTRVLRSCLNSSAPATTNGD